MKDNEPIVDTHNRCTSAQFEYILKTNMKKIIDNPELSKMIPPLMVWGAPGLGKSTIIRTVAEELGIGFIDVRLAQREPVDMRGLPVPNNADKSVDWYTSSEWPRDPNSKGIILFDEITSADRSLQVAAYEFILDRRLGKLYNLPDGWMVVGAGNRAEDRAVSTTMSSALANRFMHVEVVGNAEDWVIWGQRHDIHPSVIGFINYRPGYLFNMNGENLERGWPTPRAWERVSRMLDIYKNADDDILRLLVYGIVGNRAGVEFMEFHKINAQFDNVLEIMTHPERKIVIPVEADRKYALCAAMNYLLWRGKSKEDEEARIDGFMRICIELPSDFASMTMMAAMQGIDKNNALVYAEKVYHHPRYQEWSVKHGKALKKRYNFSR